MTDWQAVPYWPFVDWAGDPKLSETVYKMHRKAGESIRDRAWLRLGGDAEKFSEWKLNEERAEVQAFWGAE